MSEINLLAKYPQTKRNLKEASINRTDKERQIARRFDREFLMEIEDMVMEVIVIMRNIGPKLLRILKIITNFKWFKNFRCWLWKRFYDLRF